MVIHESSEKCQLYLITPPKIKLETFKYDLELALDVGNVACVQLRLKETSKSDIILAAETLAPIVQKKGIAFVLNDDPLLAKQTGCDGVHIGQNDGPLEKAREIMGSEAIVGVSCYASRDAAMQMAEKGADYVAFGAFFPTNTKETSTQPKTDLLKIWTTMTNTPCVAIGGICQENCGPLIHAGADFLAVNSSIWEYPNGHAAAVRDFNQKIIQNS